MKRLAIGLALIPALASPAAGQTVMMLCAEYSNDAELLKTFRADPEAASLEAGIADGGGLFRLMRKADGSWIIVFFPPKQRPCVIAQGEDWTVLTFKQGELL